MNKNIKKCKGFDDSLCKRCKRRDPKIEQTIPKKLSCPVSTDRKYCQHYKP